MSTANQKDQKSTNSQGVDQKAQAKMTVTHQDFKDNKEFVMTAERLEEYMSTRDDLKLLNEVRISLRVKKKHDMEELPIEDKKGEPVIDSKTGKQRVAELWKVDVSNEEIGTVTAFLKKDIYDQIEEKKIYIFYGELTSKGDGNRFFKLDKFHKVESINRILSSKFGFQQQNDIPFK